MMAPAWDQFLRSPAISYAAPSDATSDPRRRRRPRDHYWHRDLLARWRRIADRDDGDGIARGGEEGGVADIDYGSYVLMATSMAEQLTRRLSLVAAAPRDAAPSNERDGRDRDDAAADDGSRRVGIAIPEGPFLPLCVLVVHALNLAVSEGWLFLAERGGMTGVVLIPMETEEAPERLRHILGDSSPRAILVAPGRDRRSMEDAVRTVATCQNEEASSNTQLVDYVQLAEEALSSLRTRMPRSERRSLMEQLWPPEISSDCTESGSVDVARLVAVGCIRLATAFPIMPSTATAVPVTGGDGGNPSDLCGQNTSKEPLGGMHGLRDESNIAAEETRPNSVGSMSPFVPSPPPSKRRITSHIVYTSGTTGRPKGCVSSLASLLHYLRAKNLAHGVVGVFPREGEADDRRSFPSRVLLASAVTFDPCFSDVLATCLANATLCVAPRERLYGHGGGGEDDGTHGYGGLTALLRRLSVTHVLCTPTLWATVDGTPPGNVLSLEVVALGGEPIPAGLRARWARRGRRLADGGGGGVAFDREYPRLYATYGVTEACVYQTCGEVVLECQDEEGDREMNRGGRRTGQSVGPPMLGTKARICSVDGDDRDTMLPVKQKADSSEPATGEVVLSGAQVDAVSSYRNLPELTARAFVRRHRDDGSFGEDSYSYRTGDIGYVDPKTRHLHIVGRIKGDGMVKYNGIRLELSEIENAVVDDAPASDGEGLVVDCMAAMMTHSPADSDRAERGNQQLVAYCLLSAAAAAQLGLPPRERRRDGSVAGAVVPPGPLLSLLRVRCERRVRRGCVPSSFVVIDRLPLSPTGKRDRSALPLLAECSVLGGGSTGDENCGLLWAHGKVGPIVADAVCDVLNLQRCQRQLVTHGASFFALGGDSLGATRVVRGLYARYHGVLDSRNLGGATGSLDGPFAAAYLLRSNTLGEYVEFLESRLDSCSAFETAGSGGNKRDGRGMEKSGVVVVSDDGEEEIKPDPLYESLVRSITLGHDVVALSLLDLGVDPNSQPDGGRLGKVTDRKRQRSLFKSNPLHLACSRGSPHLVRKLLAKGCKANGPNASGSFPIHLACSRSDDVVDGSGEDLDRRECVQLLLDSGKTPISIKDASKQTILHCAARSGHVELLKYVMARWKVASETIGIKFKSQGNVPGRIYDWHDRWFRTPVHWAVLNGRTSALGILLDGGCSAFPPKPKSGVSKRMTGALIETPLEMCTRLYGDTGIGKEISCLLRNADY